MATRHFLAEVNIEIIKRQEFTRSIERNRFTFRGNTIEEARIQAKSALGYSKTQDPKDSGFVVIGQGDVEFWSKGLEFVTHQEEISE